MRVFLVFVASRIRGMVARTPFDKFHRYSAKIVKESIFGIDEDGNVRSVMRFSENNLVRTHTWYYYSRNTVRKRNYGDYFMFRNSHVRGPYWVPLFKNSPSRVPSQIVRLLQSKSCEVVLRNGKLNDTRQCNWHYQES